MFLRNSKDINQFDLLSIIDTDYYAVRLGRYDNSQIGTYGLNADNGPIDQYMGSIYYKPKDFYIGSESYRESARYISRRLQ